MYQPGHFEETRLEILHDLISAHPLATLVTLYNGKLSANHIPFVIDREAGTLGTLRCHVAKNNAVWKEIELESNESLVIFQGPEAYITPSWYASKKKHGKVVPTWNYAAVHAHGTVKVTNDPAWLDNQLVTLTDQQEATRPVPWEVSDAPEDFVSQQKRGVVGMELPITRIEGKWKVSQNRPKKDRKGVINGLREEQSDSSLSMSSLVEKTLYESNS
ncbi:MAG: transcriptional regulator [Rhodospirillaceae bacterium]|nr:transcriptional regulator [Rhodospirillaceae bacterium]